MLHLLAVVQIILPRALLPVVSKVLLKPNLQVESRDMVSGLFQQVEGTATVDASTQQNCNLEWRMRGLAPTYRLTTERVSSKCMRSGSAGGHTAVEAVGDRALAMDAGGCLQQQVQPKFSAVCVLESSLSRL